jgi:2-methylcitrate dehydratase
MHVGDPVKSHPANKETADHSGPFIIALAISQKDVKPEHFTELMYSDPTVSELIDKVKMEVSSEYDDPKIYPAAQVEVRMKDGSVHTHESMFHRGDPRNPMDDKEIEKKFLQACPGLLGEDNAKKLIGAVYRLEKFADISEFAELLRPWKLNDAGN